MSVPQENPFLWGHEAEEAELARAFTGGKPHHAWLLAGPKGIGKATLAYRAARWLLAGEAGKAAGAAEGPGLFGDLLPAAPAPESDLAVPQDHPVFGQVAHGSHPDLMVLSDEGENEDGKERQEISVEDVRRVGHFLSLTPSQSDWRIVIVDSADRMNRNAANALLKLLEEPPSQAVFLLVCHAPGRLLPTVRSRCRFLKLRPLEEASMLRALAHFSPDMGEEERRFAQAVASGSPGLALTYGTEEGKALYNALLAMCRNFPEIDIQESLELVQRIAARGDAAAWQRFGYLLQYLVAGVAQGGMTGEWQPEAVEGEISVKKALASKASLDKWAELWEKVNHMTADVERVNLDKRHTAICLLEAVRSVAA